VRRAALLVLILLAPSSAAATRTEGSLAMDAPVGMSGTVSAWTGGGALNLTPGVEAGSSLAFSFSSARGYRVETYVNRTVTQPSPQLGLQPNQNTSLSWGPGSLRLTRCESRCLVLLVGDGSGEVGLRGRAEGPLAWTRVDREFETLNATRPELDRFYLLVPAGWWAWGKDGQTVKESVPQARGHVILVIANALGEVRTGNGTAPLDTTRRETPIFAPATGVQIGRSVATSFAYLELEDASVEAPPGPATLYAPEGDLDLAGTLRSGGAHGWATVGGRRYDIEHEPVSFEGTLRTHVAKDPSALLPGLALPRRALVDFAGETSHASVGAVVVGDAPGLLATTPARIGLVALLGAALLGARAIFVRLYTRLGPEDVLGNLNRGRILEQIRAKPGLNVTELRVGSALSEVVVRYHLRVLEEHGWVRVQRDGRARRVFAAEQSNAMMAHAARQAAGSGSRGRLAAALCGSGGDLTQRDLSLATGIPQRLVSYHLQRMEKQGLVGRRAGNPQRYAPTARLLDALRSSG
jgi:predicted transcriptional regulator